MIKVNFYLDRKKSEQPLIFVFASHDGKRKKASCRIKIDPVNWDKKKQRAKPSKAFPAHRPINNILDQIQQTITADYYQKQLEKKSFLLKPIVAAITQPKEKSEINLITFCEAFIQQKIKEQKPKGTITVFKTAYTHIKYFNDYHYPINFNDIDLKFFKDYKDYLLIEKNFKANHANKMIAKLKQFMNESFDLGYHQNQKYKSRKFAIPKEDVDAIYYSVQELIQLYNHQYDRPALERVRDSFLIDAFTGLRFIDGVNLDPEHIIKKDGVKLLQHITTKTNTKVHIPIHWIVEEILDKYQGTPPPISNQKMNKHLKDVARLAGFTKKEIKRFTKGGIKKTEVHEKWQITTTHTARRSFATNMILADIDERVIMEIGGWKSITEFRKYIKLTSLENAIVVSKNPFWKKPKLRKVN